jgi:hypothetical protein
MKLRFGTAAIAAFLLGHGMLAMPSNAETACGSAAVLDYLPPLPRGCQRQRIEATGGLSFGIVLSAGGKARKAWERQALTFFGERYGDWKKAACKKVYCVHASFAGSRRCIYSGFPCASDMDRDALEALSTRELAPKVRPRADRELTAPEVKEMQEFLARAGYRVWIDGIFGDQTQRALVRWQRRRNLPGNGAAKLESLEQLRQISAAGG